MNPFKQIFRRSYCPVPFLIWFRGRSGSSHLSSLLDQHPQILCRREEFILIEFDRLTNGSDAVDPILYNHGRYARQINGFEHTIQNPTSKQLLRHLDRIYRGSERACGFKWKYPIQFDNFPELRPALNRIRPRIILLQRRNFVKQAISVLNRQRIQSRFQGKCNIRDSVGNASELTDKITLDVPLVLRHARRLAREAPGFAQALDAIRSPETPVLEVVYEDLLQNETRVVKQVFEFLEVGPDVQVKSRFRKATPDQLVNAIENFEQLQSAVARSEFAGMV